MSKLLIEANVFQKLLNLFFKAKSSGTEDKFISKIRYENPELGNALKKMDDSMVNSSLVLKKALQNQGVDTTEVDNFLKKYYDKV